MPGHRIRVVAADVGGGFGGKGSLYPEEIFVCAAARQLGRSVKWTVDRMEDLASTSQAFDEIVDAELALDNDGRAVGPARRCHRRHRRLFDLSVDLRARAGAGGELPAGPVSHPNYRGRVQAVATSKAPTGPYRGVGRPISTFVMERLMDMAAGKLGLDPRTIRERNSGRRRRVSLQGRVWHRLGQVWLSAVLVGGLFGHRLRRSACQTAAARKSGRCFGIGIASYAELTGIGSRISVAPGMPINTGTETAIIRIDATGAVTAAFGIASHGQGLETTLAQIVAEHLGVRFEDVMIVQGDSAAVPGGTGHLCQPQSGSGRRRWDAGGKSREG